MYSLTMLEYTGIKTDQRLIQTLLFEPATFDWTARKVVKSILLFEKGGNCRF